MHLTAAERQDASFEQMLQRLDLVFTRLIASGLSCKASKTIVCATRADYLGHTVSRQGLGMDPKKVETIREIEPTSLNSLEKIRSFLGLCSYYRKFNRVSAEPSARQGHTSVLIMNSLSNRGVASTGP